MQNPGVTCDQGDNAQDAEVVVEEEAVADGRVYTNLQSNDDCRCKTGAALGNQVIVAVLSERRVSSASY
jgi:hypothetical protein